MPPTLHDLGIDSLSAADRLNLIGEIWDSLNVQELPIPESHREEIDRRLAAADPSASRPWAKVRARLRGQE